ncbi:MAG TPA: transglycosylase SLT domain-containing protein [Candidatus Binatia bacterium]|nr:transglycosylase SLT domain-containing protein [Candidatus Binatia bacterium]
MQHQLAILVAWTILLGSPLVSHSQTGEKGETFATAYALYSGGKSGEAKELFSRMVDSEFRLADYSLYYLAAIAFNESNWEQSRQHLSQLTQGFPQSIWSQPAALLLAKIEIAEKRHLQAGEILRQMRQDKSTKRELADEALYLLAQVSEGQGEARRAYALYDELRNVSPHSRWTAMARKAQARLRNRHPDLFPLQTTLSLEEEADRLVRERQTGEGEIIYKKLLNISSDGESRLRLLTKLSALYLSVRNRGDALPLLHQIARSFPKSSEAGRALYQIGQILWNRHDNAEALTYFNSVLEKYPQSAYVDRAQFAAADIHEYFGRKNEAARMYAKLIKQHPGSPVRDDSHWRLAWLYYRNGDITEAAATFRSLAAQSKNGSLTVAALYWQARSTERIGEVESAKQLYRRIFNSGTESYYQELALRALERLGDPANEPAFARPLPVSESDPEISADVNFHLSRARTLADLSLHQLAIAELDEINARSKPSPALRLTLMREYFRSHAYGRSLNIANQAPLSQNERNFYRYPLAFWELIQQKAQERDLDPYLVLALIRQESLFDTRARSPAAALGLMQLIPPTAARVARQLSLPAPTQEMLFEPDVNLTLGTQYLKDLLLRYSNSWQKAVAAYNAGEAAVDRWEREIMTDDIEEFVERIPYLETRGYVKLVLRNHRIYKKLYDGNK